MWGSGGTKYFLSYFRANPSPPLSLYTSQKVNMYIAFDIETIAGPISPESEAMERAKLSEEYKREATIEEHLQKWRDKFGLTLEGATPVAVGLVVFEKSIRDISGERYKIISCDQIYGEDPDLIGRLFADYIVEHNPAKIIGYNIKAFDLPIMLKHIPPTANLNINPRSIVDLMFEPFGSRFDTRGGFKRLCKAYGIELSGVTGDKVADLWELDKKEGTARVANYALDDARGCYELFCYLSRFYSL